MDRSDDSKPYSFSWMGDPLKKEQEKEKPSEHPRGEKSQGHKLPHIHVERGVSSPIINIAPFPSYTSEQTKKPEEKKDKSEIGSIIDYLKEKKVLSEEDKMRISIILNMTNEIKELCKDGIDMVKTDVNFFYKLIKDKWEKAIDEMRDIDSSKTS